MKMIRLNIMKYFLLGVNNMTDKSRLKQYHKASFDLKIENKELKELLNNLKQTLPEWEKIYPRLAEKLLKN